MSQEVGVPRRTALRLAGSAALVAATGATLGVPVLAGPLLRGRRERGPGSGPPQLYRFRLGDMLVGNQRSDTPHSDDDYLSFVVRVDDDVYTTGGLLRKTIHSGDTVPLILDGTDDYAEIGPVNVYPSSEVKISILVTNQSYNGSAAADAATIVTQVAGYVKTAAPWADAVTGEGIGSAISTAVGVIAGIAATVLRDIGAPDCNGPVFNDAFAYRRELLDERTAAGPDVVTPQPYVGSSPADCGAAPHTSLTYQIINESTVPLSGRSGYAGGLPAATRTRQDAFYVNVAAGDVSGDVLTESWDYPTFKTPTDYGWHPPAVPLSGGYPARDQVVAAVTRSMSAHDVFWIDSAGRVMTSSRDLQLGPGWTAPYQIAGIQSVATGTSLAAVVRVNDHVNDQVDLFWINQGGLWWSHGNPDYRVWTTPQPLTYLGAADTSVAAVSPVPGQVVVVWTDNGAIRSAFSGSDSGRPVPPGPRVTALQPTVMFQATGAVAAVTWGSTPVSGAVRVFWTNVGVDTTHTSLDGAIFSAVSNDWSVHGWSAPELVTAPGSVADSSRLFAVTLGNRANVFWMGAQNNVYTAGGLVQNLTPSGTAPWPPVLIAGHVGGYSAATGWGTGGRLAGANTLSPGRYGVVWTYQGDAGVVPTPPAVKPCHLGWGWLEPDSGWQSRALVPGT